MESESAVVHSLAIYSLPEDEAAAHKPGPGVLTFPNLEADESSSAEKLKDPQGNDTSLRPLHPSHRKHFLRLWGRVNRLASDQGLWSVCPESRKVVLKNDKSPAVGTYTSETGETETIVMRPDKDLFFFVLNWLSVHDSHMTDAAMDNIPLFQRGVGHIAFRTSPRWYGHSHGMLHPYADALYVPDWTLRVFLDGVLDGQRRHNTIYWAEHVWLVDYELKRVEGSSTVEIKNRHVFDGNGCRFVEVRETDDAVWDFHWGFKQACKPGYRGRRKPKADDNMDDVTIFDFLNKLGISLGSERGLTMLSERPRLRLPKVGVLAFESLN